MTTLATIAIYVARVVQWIWTAAQFAALFLGVWALVDAFLRPSEHFIAAGKRTKGFWLAVNALGVAVVAITGATQLLGLLGVVVNGVYLADVRPALNLYKPIRVRSRIRKPGEDPGGRPGAGWR